MKIYRRWTWPSSATIITIIWICPRCAAWLRCVVQHLSRLAAPFVCYVRAASVLSTCSTGTKKTAARIQGGPSTSRRWDYAISGKEICATSTAGMLVPTNSTVQSTDDAYPVGTLAQRTPYHGTPTKNRDCLGAGSPFSASRRSSPTSPAEAVQKRMRIQSQFRVNKCKQRSSGS